MASTSLCLIVRNEAERLATCLESALPLVNEIIIVDTGSTDSTLAIAAHYTERIFFYPWQGDFAAARNFALEQARGEWILVLDADEYLEPSSANLLPQLTANRQVAAYLLPIHNLTVADGSDWQLSWVLRLFRRDPQLRFQGQIHEQVLVPGGYKVAVAQQGPVIIHRGYLPEQRQAKHQRNLVLLRQALAREPDNPYYHYYLGLEYLYACNYEQAWQELALALVGIPPGTFLFRTAAVSNAVQALSSLGRWQQARELLLQELAIYPDYPDYYYALGLCEQALAQYPQASQAFRLALEKKQAIGGSSLAGVSGFRSHYQLGLCYRRLRQPWAAITAFTAALKDNSAFTPALQELVITWLELSDSRTFLHWFLSHFRPDPVAILLVAELLLAAGDLPALHQLLIAGQDQLSPVKKAILQGRIAWQAGNWAEALACWQQVPPDAAEYTFARSLLVLAACLSRQETSSYLAELKGLPAGQELIAMLSWLLLETNPAPPLTAITRDFAIQLFPYLCQPACQPLALRLGQWLSQHQLLPARTMAYKAALAGQGELARQLLAAAGPQELSGHYRELSCYWQQRLPLLGGGED